MADDDKELSLREQVAAAFDGGGDDGEQGGSALDKSILGAEPDGASTSAERDAVQRTRDEQGRFAKAQEAEARKTLSLKEKPETQAASTAALRADVASPASAPSPAPNGTAPERIAAPTTWLGAAKTKWDRLPREVQQEIAQRETEREAAAGELAPLKELYDTNRAFLVGQAGSVVEATRQMMQFARMTETVDGSIALAQHILRSKGIDPAALLGGQQAPQPAPGQQQPGAEALIERMLQQRLQPLQAHFEAQQQQQTQATVAQVQAFVADPAHPYFNDVAPTIERLLSSGEVPPGDPMTRLKDAYERATWANPQIRSQLMAATTEEAGKRQAAEAEKARLAARTSLRGSPLPNGHAAAGGKGQSVRDAVAQAYDEASGA